MILFKIFFHSFTAFRQCDHEELIAGQNHIVPAGNDHFFTADDGAENRVLREIQLHLRHIEDLRMLRRHDFHNMGIGIADKIQ